QEIEAVPEAALARINLDVSSACTIALGAADLVWPMLPELRTLPSYDYAAVEKLRLYALAALYANAVATEATGGKRVALILAEASPLRESLLVAAEALAH